MKFFNNFLLYLCFFICFSTYAQVVWFEDFETYSIGTGYVGSLSPTLALPSGDYPAEVNKWFIDTAHANLTANSDWLSVQEDELGNQVFEIRDSDGEFYWSSEVIDISNYFDIVLSVSISENSVLESTDYINIYYKLNGGDEVLFETNGSNADDFTNAQVLQDSIVGNSIQVIIRAKNNAGTEQIRFDNVSVIEKSLLITEITATSENSTGFIELKNCSNHTLDFDTTAYYLSVQTDGVQWNDLKLVGSLCSGCIRFYAHNSTNFNSMYGFQPPLINSIIDGDGNDAYFIYFNGDHSTGTLVDVYGVLNENGTNTTWSYENSRVIRNPEILVASPLWFFNQWSISLSSLYSSTPGALENELRYYNEIWHPYSNHPNLNSNDLAIVVQSGLYAASQSFSCENLTILKQASLLINPGQVVQVNGNLVLE
jgi:hypothetical protein